MSTAQPHPIVDDLRAALRKRDVEEAARLLPQVHIAVAVFDRQPRVANVHGRRVLPVFLSHDSWVAFRSNDDVAPLAPELFAQLLQHRQVDAVVFDPALESAVEVPAADVLRLLT